MSGMQYMCNRHLLDEFLISLQCGQGMKFIYWFFDICRNFLCGLDFLSHMADIWNSSTYAYIY